MKVQRAPWSLRATRGSWALVATTASSSIASWQRESTTPKQQRLLFLRVSWCYEREEIRKERHYAGWAKKSGLNGRRSCVMVRRSTSVFQSTAMARPISNEQIQHLPEGGRRVRRRPCTSEHARRKRKRGTTIEKALSFTEFDRRVSALPDGPVAILDSSPCIANVIGVVAAVLTLISFALIQFMPAECCKKAVRAAVTT